MPSQITSPTANTATAYSNQRKIDRCQNGVLWTIYHGGGGAAVAAYSTDNGANWTRTSQDANSNAWAGGFNGTAYLPNVSFFIDIDDYAHVIYKDGIDGFLYYRRGNPNAGRTAWTWSASKVIASFTGADYPDIVTHREGTGWTVHIIHSYNAGNPYYVTFAIDAAGNQGTATQSTVDTGIATHTYPSIDFNHTGDGKTVAGSVPHLYAAWSAGVAGAGKGIRFKKATYNAGTWTWGAGRDIDTTRYIGNVSDWLNCLYDGTRAIITGSIYDGANRDLMFYERDAADTTTLTRLLLDNATTSLQLYNGSTTYDSLGNVYLMGANTDETEGARDLVYRRWVRATTTLDPEVLIDSAVTQANVFISAKRGYSNGRMEFIYLDGTASPYQAKYSYIGDQADIYPTNVSTSTVFTATAHSNQRKIDRTSNGVTWAVWDVGSVGRYDFAYSTNKGATWTGVMGPNLPGGTGRTYGTACSFFIDIDDYAHFVFKDLANGSIYYFRGTPNAGRTAWTWNAATTIWAGTAMDYPDVVAFRDPASAGWHVCFVAGYLSGSANLAGYARIPIASNGTLGAIQRDNLVVLLSNDGALNSNINSYNGYSKGIHTFPSIDFYHTGDGKTVKGGTPHIYTAWSAGGTGAGFGIRFRAGIYSAGSWTWNPEREIDSARYASSSNYVPVCMFDGTRCVIAGATYDGTNANPDVIVHDRDAADTTTTTRAVYELAGSTDAYGLLQTSCSYDSLGNVYIFGRSVGQAAGSRFFQYRVWYRATGTLGASMSLDSTGVYEPYVSAKRGFSGGKIEIIYMDGTASPYALTYSSFNLNSSPNVPTGLTVTSTSSDTTPVFSAVVSDPDTSNLVRGSFDIQKLDGTPIGAVDSGTVTGSGSVTAEYTTTLSTGYYQVRVKSIDENGAESAYSAWVSFTINTPPGAPVVSAPLPTQVYRFNWQFSDVDAGDGQTRSEGEIRRQSDGVLVYGWDVSNSVQYHEVDAATFPVGTYNWKVRTYDNLGVAGAWSSPSNFTVSNASNVSVRMNGAWVSSSGTKVS